MKARHVLPALGLLVLGAAVPGAAFAQADRSPPPVDQKPLIPPIIPPPLLPPNSLLTPGSVRDAQSPYSSAPAYGPTQDQATPGLRFTIPTR